jgi:hypothetical protein
MDSRFLRKLSVGMALAGALAMAPGTAWADGTQTPQGAPTVQVGVPRFGNTADPNKAPYQDYYRLPNLLAQDVVTVAALPQSGVRASFCLAGNVDQFNWEQEGCNLSQDVYVDSFGKRIQFTAARATNLAYLRVGNIYYLTSPDNAGPYQFTVEKIQHRLALTISAPAQVSRNGQVTVRTFLTNGAGAANGHRLSLAVIVGGRSYNYVATVSNGRAVFQLNLPADTEGKTATLKASSSSSSTTYTGASATGSTRIVK